MWLPLNNHQKCFVVLLYILKNPDFSQQVIRHLPSIDIFLIKYIIILILSRIINGIDETKRSESAYFNRATSLTRDSSTCLTRENTLKSSKNSLDVDRAASPVNLHQDHDQDSDSVYNEDSGFTSIKVILEANIVRIFLKQEVRCSLDVTFYLLSSSPKTIHYLE